ncbi:nucleoside phosphorylase [Mariannaea sp. PMI_226]|nr:nucleoside phosphorylase [Mariannaea sp. PMI_226]
MYTVGWVCALPKELTAATAMLDERHPKLLSQPKNDRNNYTLGSIGKHNIVLVCLPKGRIGTNSAAITVTEMANTFPNVKFGLMVGIGGGVPPNVKLGDVVVSTPVDHHPGLIQWDFGKAEEGGNFKQTGAPNKPPVLLLNALDKLKAEQRLKGSKINQFLNDLELNWPQLKPKYSRPPSIPGSTATSERIDPHIHYGLIASGNQVIKDAKFRDCLNERYGGKLLCVEMEAAGLMEFPSIVIRGICDYADSKKNKDWQEYAAATAAAYAKELLGQVPPYDVNLEIPLRDTSYQVFETTSSAERKLDFIKARLEREEAVEILDWLTPIDYNSQQANHFSKQQTGTGQWFLRSEEYQTWLKCSKKTLFCPGIPGAGKTILASIVINDLLTRFRSDTSYGIAYIYCNFRKNEEQTVENMLASLLKQLSASQLSPPRSLESLHDVHKSRQTRPTMDEISSTLQYVVESFSRVFIVVDALDECQASNGCRARLISEISELQSKCGVNALVTSRFIPEITEMFEGAMSTEIRATDDDLQRYLDGHMPQLPKFDGCSTSQQGELQDQLQEEIKTGITKAVDGVFLLAQIYIDSFICKRSPRAIKNAIQSLCRESKGQASNITKLLQSAYDQTMERIETQPGDAPAIAKEVLAWVVCAKRPMHTSELYHALAVNIGNSELDRQNFTQVDIMVSVCAGLVAVDEESGNIRLVHYTIEEYLKDTLEKWFPNAEAHIAAICTTYLSLNIFHQAPGQTDDEFREPLQSYYLYRYASEYLEYHTEQASISNQRVMNSLESEAKVQDSN